MKRSAKFLVLVLGLALTLTLVSCKKQPPKPAEPDPPAAQEPDNPQIPNPIVEYGTQQEAMTALGFEFMLPTLDETYGTPAYSVIDGTTGQVLYEKDGRKITYRVSKGTGDISGDLNKYSMDETATIGDRQVQIRGEEDAYNVATWTEGEYAYAISVNPGGAGITRDELEKIINSIQAGETKP